MLRECSLVGSVNLLIAFTFAAPPFNSFLQKGVPLGSASDFVRHCYCSVVQGIYVISLRVITFSHKTVYILLSVWKVHPLSAQWQCTPITTSSEISHHFVRESTSNTNSSTPSSKPATPSSPSSTTSTTLSSPCGSPVDFRALCAFRSRFVVDNRYNEHYDDHPCA
jgi:hypothetical protein